jgi:hypothetical protein
VTADVASTNELLSTADRIRNAIAATDAYVDREEFSGYDPYDALLSPLFRLPLLRSNHYVKLAAQQGLRRLAVNLRPLLGIRKHASPVTYARMLEGYVFLLASRADERDYYEQQIAACIRRLRELRSPGYSGDCWGYEFDWEARYGVIPTGVPNVVATGIVTNALFEAYRLAGDEGARTMCESAAEFVLHDLRRTPAAGGGFCWSYSPLDGQAVLNATMKGARLCAQVFSFTGDSRLGSAAQETVSFVLDHQREDGAWPYAVGDRRSWVDNFHTGYLLDCLASYERHTHDDAVGAAKSRGWRYYRAHFLTNDYAPKYFDQSVRPIDATACAQTITTLCTFGDLTAAARSASWTLANMATGDGAFVYRRHALLTNRISYMRWSVAPMFCALSHLLAAIDSSVHGNEPTDMQQGIPKPNADAAGRAY